MESLKLNAENIDKFQDSVTIPKYDRSSVKAGIVHVGIGGFHRSHQAFYCDQLLHDKEQSQWGICGVALLERDDSIYKTLKEQDGLYTLIVKEFDGSWKARIIGSIVDYLFAPENPKAVIEKMADPGTKLITLTITEGGYNFDESTGEFNMENPLIQHDLAHPELPKTIFGYLTQALKLRKARGLKGCTVQSCDNIQGNGKIMKRTLLEYVKVAESGLTDWIHDNVSFPNSMVDRITPVTEKNDIVRLKDDFGVEDSWPVVCEPFTQWVIEDTYSNGRPKWETLGAKFVKDVAPYEKMKLRLLNAGHSVLGIFGALLGYKTIDEAIEDKELRTFLADFMDKEVTPRLDNLPGVDLGSYKQSLIQRFGNHNIKDQVSRICSESSTKLPKFLLPTVRENLEQKGPINQTAFVIAAWAIYSKGISEKGDAIEIIDVMKDELREKVAANTESPVVFLEISAVFGNLVQSDRFVDSYLTAYENISKSGLKESLQSLL